MPEDNDASKTLIESENLTEREQEYVVDATDFWKSGRGRPDFKGKVEQGDKKAVEFWIQRIPKMIGAYDIEQLRAVFAYFGDLTGKSNNALTEADAGQEFQLKELRLALLEKLESLPLPKDQKDEASKKFFERYWQLTVRALGMFTANPILDRVQNVNDPDEKYQQLIPEIQNEIRKKIEYLRTEEEST